MFSRNHLCSLIQWMIVVSLWQGQGKRRNTASDVEKHTNVPPGFMVWGSTRSFLIWDMGTLMRQNHVIDCVCIPYHHLDSTLVQFFNNASILTCCTCLKTSCFMLRSSCSQPCPFICLQSNIWDQFRSQIWPSSNYLGSSLNVFCQPLSVQQLTIGD